MPSAPASAAPITVSQTQPLPLPLASVDASGCHSGPSFCNAADVSEMGRLVGSPEHVRELLCAAFQQQLCTRLWWTSLPQVAECGPKGSTPLLQKMSLHVKHKLV